MRYVRDAIMTGANTIIADDPRLTVRLADKGGTTRRQPVRIIVDGQGRTPPQSRIFAEPGKTIVVLADNVTDEIKRPLKEAGAELLELPAPDGNDRSEGTPENPGESGRLPLFWWRPEVSWVVHFSIRDW
jgi:diaminohydroxyphosphoribosylaminopyrimidine deaminase/5-amino-6-(5-phosphoribosylamino)uracil reductase